MSPSCVHRPRSGRSSWPPMSTSLDRRLTKRDANSPPVDEREPIDCIRLARRPEGARPQPHAETGRVRPIHSDLRQRRAASGCVGRLPAASSVSAVGPEAERQPWPPRRSRKPPDAAGSLPTLPEVRMDRLRTASSDGERASGNGKAAPPGLRLRRLSPSRPHLRCGCHFRQWAMFIILVSAQTCSAAHYYVPTTPIRFRVRDRRFLLATSAVPRGFRRPNRNPNS